MLLGLRRDERRELEDTSQPGDRRAHVRLPRHLDRHRPPVRRRRPRDQPAVLPQRDHVLDDVRSRWEATSTAVLGRRLRDAAAGAHDPADWTRPSRFPIVAASGRRVVNMHALRPRACAPVPRPARPQPRRPLPRWSRRHSRRPEGGGGQQRVHLGIGSRESGERVRPRRTPGARAETMWAACVARVGASSGSPYRAQRNLPQLMDDTEAWQRRDSSSTRTKRCGGRG